MAGPVYTFPTESSSTSLTSRPPQSHPRIGVGVFIFDDEGRFIVGKRKGSHGAGTLSLAGGHLELHESFTTCAARETLEETGLEIKDIRFLTAVNSVFPEGPHYVTIFMGSRRVDGAKDFQVLEPDKCEYWKWTSQTELADEEEVEVFLPLRNLLRNGVGDGESRGGDGVGFDSWEAYQGLMSGVKGT